MPEQLLNSRVLLWENLTGNALSAKAFAISVPGRIDRRSHLYMKTKTSLLTLLAAVSAFALLATPAQAGGRHHHRGWNNCGHGYYHRGWNNSGYGYYRPYYRPVYYYPAPCYRPVFYAPAPVVVFGFGFR